MATDTTNTMPARPNFFILLGLDPNAPWDQAAFDEALNKKRREWSSQQQGVGKMVLTAKQYLSYIPTMQAVMLDEVQRDAEASLARVLLVKEREARGEEFKKQLAFINAKDSIDPAELTKLIADFHDTLSEAEITAQITVAVANPAASGPAEEKFLDSSLMKNIADRLSIIKKTSLYDLLGLSDATATQELFRAAEELYKDMMRRMSKTAEVTAMSELAGHARNIFQTEDMRKRYDASRHRATLDHLLEDLDAVVNRATSKELQAGQVNVFLTRAQQAGWKHEDAYERLKEHARQRKWFLEPTTIEPKTRCRNCQTLNAQDRKLCDNCGAELYIACPDCGSQVPSEDRICNNCGFVVGNRFMVDNGLQEVKRFFDAGNYRRALAVLQTVEDAWKPKNIDQRLEHVRDYKLRLTNIEQQRREAVQEKEQRIQELLSQKKLIEAQAFLGKQGADLPDREQIKRRIEAGIIQVQRLVNTMRNSPNLSIDEQIELWRQAEELCSDYPGLSRLRVAPSPPRNLQARVRGTTVSLSWEPSTTKNIFYTIVRKSQSQPNDITDGTQLPNPSPITGNSYDDTAAPVGIPLYYAVYSGYDTMRSTLAAMLAHPVMVKQGVISLTAKVDNALVDLSWDTPPNVASVVVVRKEQSPPTSMNDGVRIGEYRPPLSGLTDQTVKNGQLYYYALYCQYKDQEGRLVASQPEVINVTPDVPPEIIHQLDIQSTRLETGYELVIRWQRPNKGSVIIMKTAQTFRLPAGQVIPAADLANYGQRLDEGLDATKDRWPGPGAAYYTPVVIYQGMAYIGPSKKYVCIDNISQLEYKNLGNAIRLKWKWPANCYEVLIRYTSDEGYTESERKVIFAEYDRNGYFDLRGTGDQDYTITLSAIIEQDGAKIMADGLHIQARQKRQLVMSYEIKNPSMLQRKRILQISARTTGASQTLPELVLVGRRDRIPFKKTDGDVIMRISPMQIKDKAVIALPERPFPPKTFCRLFLANDSDRDTVIINHPEENKLRLS